MKKRSIIVLAALMMSATVPAFAAEPSNQEQVICNLASKNCLSSSQAIEKKMKKVKEDMKKGKTYSAEDLQKIEKKLKEVQDMVDQLQPKPAAK
jgi:Skp family chaperone for outer membrane proteins